jgi:phage FluMu protein Com
MEESLKDHRCITCNSLLFKYSLLTDKDVIVIEIKCSRCNSLTRFEIDAEHLLRMYQTKKLKRAQQE